MGCFYAERPSNGSSSSASSSSGGGGGGGSGGGGWRAVTSQLICISSGDLTSFCCFDAKYANEFINSLE